MPSLRNWRKKRVTKSDDKKVPALRFKGFTDDWEQRKPNNFLTESKIIGHKGNQAKKLTVKLWGKGIQEKQNTYSGSEKTQYYIRKSGQLMYGKLDFLHAAFGIVPNNLNNYESTIDSPAFDVKNANSSFLLNLFLRKNFYLYYGERANGSRKARRIHEKDFLMMPIKIPSIQEQNQIVFLIKIINKSITLQQRKLKQLDLLKKAMLQQILTTNDYPKIRFRGFTNVWDQRRLEKIAKITTGKLDANAMVKNGKYDFYTSGIKKFKINTAAFEGPAITIAGNGATVGYMHLADGKFNAYQRTYVLNQFTVNRLFLFYSVKKVLPRSIYQSARTGNIPYIVLNMITDLKVNVPKEKEQKKIGELFTEIQAILINQKNRLRCIKDLKQYLLQNIFL